MANDLRTLTDHLERAREPSDVYFFSHAQGERAIELKKDSVRAVVIPDKVKTSNLPQ
jgi:hypothetical protein